MKKIIFLILITSFVSCVTLPTKEQFDAADFGEPPKNYIETINQKLKNYMYDPEFLMNRIEAPRKMGYSFSNLGGKHEFFGYGVCAYVNAKNRLGAYSGYTLYLFLFKNEELKEMHNNTGSGYLPFKEVVNDRCIHKLDTN